MTIRIADVADHARIDEIMMAASLSNPSDAEWVLANRELVCVPASQILAGQAFLAEMEGQFVGFAVVVPLVDDGFELDGLFVDPRWTRRGIGRALVSHAVALAGNRPLWVVGNPEAGEFYTKCGFVQVGEAQTLNGVALRMVRNPAGHRP